MKINTLTVSICLCFTLCACGGDGNDGHRTFDDFESEVFQSTEPDAKNCGVIRLGEEYFAANTCAAESFSSQQAFAAVYELRGIDSNVGVGLSMDTNLNVSVWYYDSNPCGGTPPCPSRIEETKCSNPSLSGILDSSPDKVFLCDENLDNLGETLEFAQAN